MGSGRGVGAGAAEGEGQGVGSGLMRCFLVFVNIIFGLIGFVLLGAGIFLKVGQSLYMPFVDEIIASVPSFTSGTNIEGAASPSSELTASFDLILDGVSTGLIVVGLFLFVAAILGCIGGCCRVKVILIIYAVIIGLLVIGQIVFIILFATGYIEEQIKIQLKAMVTDKFISIDSFTAESLILNILMIQFKCCGIDDYKDFQSATQWRNTRDVSTTVAGVTVTETLTLKTPIACCKTEGAFPSVSLNDNECAFEPQPPYIITGATTFNNNMDTGCFGQLIKELDNFRTIIIGVFAGIIAFQALLFLFVVLILVFKNQEENEVV